MSTGESSESGVDRDEGSSSLWYSLLHCSVSFPGSVGVSSSWFTKAYLSEGANSSAQNCSSSNLYKEFCRLECGKVKHQSLLQLTLLAFCIITSQFCFETGCFVYHLNVLKAEYFKLRTLFQA